MPDRSYRYIVRKILNNNALISEDENNREIIVTGKGIGFHAHVGMKVDSSKIFKAVFAHVCWLQYTEEGSVEPRKYIQAGN